MVSDAQQTVRTHEQIAERLRQLPGVQSVGLASSITMDGISFNGSILVEEFPETGSRARPFRRHRFIAPGFFETMGNPVLMGRTITWTDIYQDALVAVVSEAAAREYWKNPADAIGKRIRVSPNQPWREIIGIVGNERDDGLKRGRARNRVLADGHEAVPGRAVRFPDDVCTRSDRTGSIRQASCASS